MQIAACYITQQRRKGSFNVYIIILVKNLGVLGDVGWATTVDHF